MKQNTESIQQSPHWEEKCTCRFYFVLSVHRLLILPRWNSRCWSQLEKCNLGHKVDSSQEECNIIASIINCNVSAVKDQTLFMGWKNQLENLPKLWKTKWKPYILTIICNVFALSLMVKCTELLPAWSCSPYHVFQVPTSSQGYSGSAWMEGNTFSLKECIWKM